jgi:hypothetical protein
MIIWARLALSSERICRSVVSPSISASSIRLSTSQLAGMRSVYAALYNYLILSYARIVTIITIISE